MGERTYTGEGTNRIADFEFGDFGTDGIDDARVIGSRNERQSEFFLILTKDLEVVGVIQAGGLDSIETMS